jgi:hypothetical protein
MADAESISTLGHKRTLPHLNAMSAFLLRADIGTLAGCQAIYGVMCVAPAIIFSLMRVNFAETSAPVNFLLGAKASVYEAVFMMNGLPPPEPLLIHTLLE